MTEKPKGNGAREALIDILGEQVDESHKTYGLSWVDWLLIELAKRGYIVKPFVEH